MCIRGSGGRLRSPATTPWRSQLGVERTRCLRYYSNISSKAAFPAACGLRGGVHVGEGVPLNSATSAEAGGKTGAVARLEVDAAHRLATARGLLRRLEDRASG